MSAHEIRCLIAKYSADPDNEPAMRMAAFYSACLREMERTDDETEDAA